tara:strand:+ start:2380 stop:2721 length:342 start_codon:yes stop_codon:yes gene_type:complete
MDRRDLTEVSQLDDIDANSLEGKGVLIFKHSTRCIISKMVWQNLSSDWSNDLEDLPVYFLDLISDRALSQQVADRYGVHHESPQALLIKGGKCVYHDSHHGINQNEIKNLVDA